MGVSKQIPDNAIILDSYLLALAKEEGKLNDLPTLI